MTKLPDHLVAGQVPPCRIWLDGIERQNGVIEAHLTEGWIIQCCPGPDGLPVVVGDEFPTEKLFGVVTAELIEDQP